MQALVDPPNCTFYLSCTSQVKFLENSLEQAKQAELGRNALIKQVKKLEEEVKHSRHRLEKHHAEALASVEHLAERKHPSGMTIPKNHLRNRAGEKPARCHR